MSTGIKERPRVREGSVFKRYRIRARITQRELGKQTGIPLSMIKEYEQGRCLPGPERLVRLMTRLGIPADALTQKGSR